MDFAHFVGTAAVIKDAFGDRSLAGIDMSHDTDIADSV
jgi:hypothetical protein